MSLIRFEPFRELEDEMHHTLSRVFGQRWPNPGNGSEGRWVPAVDVKETAEEYVIHAELPGLTKSDFKVKVDNEVLTLSGERKRESEEKGRTFHRVERSHGSFVRSFNIPEDVDVENIKADFGSAGVLDIHMPKREDCKPKAFEVSVN